jgi:hypothetical protein
MKKPPRMILKGFGAELALSHINLTDTSVVWQGEQK